MSYIEQNNDEFIFSCALSADGKLLALRFHSSNPSEKDIDEFMLVLQNKDLGCLKREGIKKKIQEYQKAMLRQQYRAQGRCEHCGGKFKGLFKKSCSVCGSPKSY